MTVYSIIIIRVRSILTRSICTQIRKCVLLTLHYLDEYSIPTLSLNGIIAISRLEIAHNDASVTLSEERGGTGAYSLFIRWSEQAARTISQNWERVARRDDTSGHITGLLDSEMGRQTGPLNRDMWMHAGLESWLVGGGSRSVCMDVLFYQRPRCVLHRRLESFNISADFVLSNNRSRLLYVRTIHESTVCF